MYRDIKAIEINTHVRYKVPGGGTQLNTGVEHMHDQRNAKKGSFFSLNAIILENRD